MKTKLILLLGIIMLLLCSTNCKKKKDTKIDPRVPPNLDFKTTAGYTYTNDTLAKAQTFTVGVTGTKTEDLLTSFNVSYAYDGASTTTSWWSYALTPVEYQGFSKDIVLTTRNQSGTEKWIFTVVDKDGNITQKSLNFLVQ